MLADRFVEVTPSRDPPMKHISSPVASAYRSRLDTAVK